MKYSSTVRLINTVIFALLLVGFACLGIYFGLLVAPFIFPGRGSLLGDLPAMSYGLAANLGVLGLAGTIVSLAGFIFAVKSLVKGNDDRAVVSTFAAYIAVGLTLVGFLFLNATWLYRLTSSNLGFNDTAFVIIVYVIALFIIGFASLAPMVRLFGDNDKYHTIMKIISGVTFAGSCATALVFFLAYINSNIYVISNGAVVSTEFLLGFLLPLAAAIFAGIAFFRYGRSEKKNVVSKLDGYLFEAALALIGGSIVTAGIVEHINQGSEDLAVSLISASAGTTNANYLDFAIMSYIVGGILVLAAIYFAYQTTLGTKAKVAKDN